MKDKNLNCKHAVHNSIIQSFKGFHPCSSVLHSSLVILYCFSILSFQNIRYLQGINKVHMVRCTNVATFESCPSLRSRAGNYRDDINFVPDIKMMRL